MNRGRWLLVAALPCAAVGGFYGYRALGSRLVASMTTTAARDSAIVENSPAAKPPMPSPAPGVSGLDLIARPSARGSARSPAPNPVISNAQAAAIRQAGIGLVDSLTPMLKDPAFISRLSPQQAKQYGQLMALLAQSEAAAKSDRPIDLGQMALNVQKAQQLSLGLMSQISQAAPPPAQKAGPGP